MALVSTEASLALLIVSTIGGAIGGLVAVWLAQNMPQRMDVEIRERPNWWWGIAVLVGAAYGLLIPTTAHSWALLPAFLTFGAATLGLTLIDLDHQLIPDRILFPTLGIATVLLAGGALVEAEGGALLRALSGAVVYFLFLLIVGLVARGGFGMGDVKLALLLGLFLGYVGWDVLIGGSILAILLGGFASILVLVFTSKGREARFAYGPYLVAGAWIGVLWGEQLVDWYLGIS